MYAFSLKPDMSLYLPAGLPPITATARQLHPSLTIVFSQLTAPQEKSAAHQTQTVTKTSQAPRNSQ